MSKERKPIKESLRYEVDVQEILKQKSYELDKSRIAVKELEFKLEANTLEIEQLNQLVRKYKIIESSLQSSIEKEKEINSQLQQKAQEDQKTILNHSQDHLQKDIEISLNKEELQKIKKNLEHLQQEVTKLKQDLNEKEKELQKIQSQNTSLNAELKKDQKQLEAQTKEIQQLINNLIEKETLILNLQKEQKEQGENYQKQIIQLNQVLKESNDKTQYLDTECRTTKSQLEIQIKITKIYLEFINSLEESKDKENNPNIFYISPQPTQSGTNVSLSKISDKTEGDEKSKLDQAESKVKHSRLIIQQIQTKMNQVKSELKASLDKIKETEKKNQSIQQELQCLKQSELENAENMKQQVDLLQAEIQNFKSLVEQERLKYQTTIPQIQEKLKIYIENQLNQMLMIMDCYKKNCPKDEAILTLTQQTNQFELKVKDLFKI